MASWWIAFPSYYLAPNGHTEKYFQKYRENIMGSFGGHILPGTCYLIFGTWFPIQKMIGTFHAKRNTGITNLFRNFANFSKTEFLRERINSINLCNVVIYNIGIMLFWSIMKSCTIFETNAKYRASFVKFRTKYWSLIATRQFINEQTH